MPQQSGRKSRTGQTAIKLQKQAFQKIKTPEFSKMQKEGILYKHKYFQIGTSARPLAQCDLKKPYFYKGNTLSDWDRAQLARAKIQVCVFTKHSSCPMGCAICDFLASFVVATQFL